jgi:hypothetical protein
MPRGLSDTEGKYMKQLLCWFAPVRSRLSRVFTSGNLRPADTV